MAEYKLPDVGEGLTEAEIVSWKVKVGDEVKVNDVVVEIETAKSLVELPSPFAGTVTAILVPEGETVEVGTPIIAIGDAAPASASGGSAGPEGAQPAARSHDAGEIDLSNPAASGGGEGESLVGRMKADRGALRRARRRTAPEVAGTHTARADVQDVFNAGAPQQHEKVERIVDAVTSDAAAQGGAVQGGAVQGGAVQGGAAGAADPSVAAPPANAAPDEGATRVLAKPPVRKLAKDLGVDLRTVTPTGPDDTVTRDDVQAAAGSGTSYEVVAGAARAQGVPAAQRETREPIKGVRKMMGQAMVDSAFTVPHVTEWLTVDVTATTRLVERLRERRELAGMRVTPLLVLARACLLAMRRTPEINSFWDDAAQEIVYKSYVNLGIAAATPRGLVVPNVKGAESLSLPELAEALAQLTATAREGRTQPAEMSGGTFTITNVGPFGVDGGTPIINPGESAILCFGATKRQPWVVGTGDDERLEIRDVCTLALSFDHRHIDGEKGSRFLADVAGIMGDPGTALLF